MTTKSILDKVQRPKDTRITPAEKAFIEKEFAGKMSHPKGCVPGRCSYFFRYGNFCYGLRGDRLWLAGEYEF